MKSETESELTVSVVQKKIETDLFGWVNVGKGSVKSKDLQADSYLDYFR